MKKRITNLTFLFVLTGLMWSHSSCDYINYLKDKRSGVEKPKIVKTFYPNGNLKNYYTYLNERRNGVCRSYYANGKMHLEVYYKDDIKHGLAKQFYQNGKIYRETPYVNGKAHGVQKKYFKTGGLMAEVPYVQGKQASGMREYSPSGNVLVKYPEIMVHTTDKISVNGTYTIDLSLSDGANYTQFYVDRFLFTRMKENFGRAEEFMIKDRDETLLMDGYYPVYSEKGKAGIVLDVPAGFAFDQEVTFAASFQTRRNNTYISYKKVRLKFNN
ncbi:MAG: toxin-antitoxin system YwqK family antitoxin [Bacteroidota bacterium]